jgi:hypothetical protein
LEYGEGFEGWRDRGEGVIWEFPILQLVFSGSSKLICARFFVWASSVFVDELRSQFRWEKEFTAMLNAISSPTGRGMLAMAATMI